MRCCERRRTQNVRLGYLATRSATETSIHAPHATSISPPPLQHTSFYQLAKPDPRVVTNKNHNLAELERSDGFCHFIPRPVTKSPEVASLQILTFSYRTAKNGALQQTPFWTQSRSHAFCRAIRRRHNSKRRRRRTRTSDSATTHDGWRPRHRRATAR